MNVNTELASSLQKLIDLEPNLAQELQGAESVDQAIERLAAVASRHGITLETTELTALFQKVGETLAKGELTDEQLAGVDGGIDFQYIFHHILKNAPIIGMFYRLAGGKP